MRIGRVPLEIFILILVGICVLAGLVYIELSQDVTSATVLSKRERIVTNATRGSWMRRTEALVLYRVDGRPYQRWIRMDTGSYDEVTSGADLEVRYVSLNPIWARPASQSTLSSLVQNYDPWQAFTWTVLIAGIIFAGYQHWAWRIDRWWMVRRSVLRRLAVYAGVLLWLAIVVTGYIPPPWPDVGDAARDATAEARIREVTTITQVGGGNRQSGDALLLGLPQGIDRVELSFTPEGMADPVIAVDEVDEGSAGDLSSGVTVPITLAPDDPRGARMVAGERSHRWLNPLVIQSIVLGVATVLLSAPLLWRWYRGGPPQVIERRRRRKPRR